MVKNFLVVRQTPYMRIIIGCVRNCEVDASIFLRRLASRCDFKLSELSIIADAEPRTFPMIDMAKVRRELEHFKATQAEYGEDADPVGIAQELIRRGEEFAVAISNTIAGPQYANPLGQGGDDEDGDSGEREL